MRSPGFSPETTSALTFAEAQWAETALLLMKTSVPEGEGQEDGSASGGISTPFPLSPLSSFNAYPPFTPTASSSASASPTFRGRKGGGGGGEKSTRGSKKRGLATDLCQTCLERGIQRGITHWHRDMSRSTGGICRDHAQQLFDRDPQGFAKSYRMRHGRACEHCGILRRATHGLISEGVSRFCGECAMRKGKGCVDLNNFKCKVQACKRMARFIGESDGQLAFRCWVHKTPEMKEAGDAWHRFYTNFVGTPPCPTDTPPLTTDTPTPPPTAPSTIPPPPPLPSIGAPTLTHTHTPAPLPVPSPKGPLPVRILRRPTITIPPRYIPTTNNHGNNTSSNTSTSNNAGSGMLDGCLLSSMTTCEESEDWGERMGMGMGVLPNAHRCVRARASERDRQAMEDQRWAAVQMNVEGIASR